MPDLRTQADLPAYEEMPIRFRRTLVFRMSVRRRPGKAQRSRRRELSSAGGAVRYPDGCVVGRGRVVLSWAYR